jgi:hypothetical protein
MIAKQGKVNRQMLPRWRSSALASNAPEFASVKRPPIVSANLEGDLLRLRSDFERMPSAGTAAELLTAAKLASREVDIEQAKDFLLRNSSQTPHSILAALSDQNNLSEEHFGSYQSASSAVAKLRLLLKLNPDNAVLWADLSRHHAINHDKTRAQRCMITALQLAPNHRWILRVASRFFVHIQDPERAHSILSKHQRTKLDPWLMAAEIATAKLAERASSFSRIACDLLQKKSHSPSQINELALAVAMTELDNGKSKVAKKHIRQGLIAPTENTLAQVSWAEEQRSLHGDFSLSERVSAQDDAHEADYRLSLLRGDVPGAVDAALKWSLDEPYSKRPKISVAYAASILDDHDLAIRHLKDVIHSGEQTDPVLEMNLIFSELSSGQFDRVDNASELIEIRHKLERVAASGGRQAYHPMANLGLWCYRYGDPSEGRLWYEKSIDNALKNGLTESAAGAATFAAREAILASDRGSSEKLVFAKQLQVKSKSLVCDFYISKLEQLLRSPNNALDILSPQSNGTAVGILRGVNEVESTVSTDSQK